MRWPAPNGFSRLVGWGLRPRLVAALVLTSAASLGVAALAVLGPLEQRLRQDTGTTLVAAGGSAQQSFVDVLGEGDARSRPLRHLVRGLERRTGAAITVFDLHGKILATSDPDEPGRLSAVPGTLPTRRTTRHVVRDDLVVAIPLHAGQRYILVMRKRLTDVRTSTRVVRRAIVKAAIVGLAAALLLGLGLATTLLRRLNRLRDAVRAIESDVEGAAAPAPDSSRDEVGELSRAFAAMQSHLRRQEAARRTFVAVASHELRTPLTSMYGTLELLEDDLRGGAPDLDDARLQVARARAQSQRLAGLATDLLDLSRIDAEVELRAEAVPLEEVARAVAAEFAARAPEKGAPVTISGSESAWACGDPGAVARIVRILLDNALRVSPDGVPVEVDVARPEEDGMVAITVSDTGPGVPVDDRERIFERFQRGTSTSAGAGFGLGLAIGRELAIRMGGTLELDADGGRGARFVLRLPAHEAERGA